MYGPVRTVVWYGSGCDRCPYTDQVGLFPGKRAIDLRSDGHSQFLWTAIAPAWKALRPALSASAKAFAMLTESAGG